MRILLLIILLSFSGISLKAQTDLDSLRRAWQDPSLSDSSRLAALREMIWKGYLFRDPDSAQYFCEQQLEFARKSGEKWAEADALMNQGIIFHQIGELDLAMELFERGYKISVDCQDTGKQMDGLTNIGIVHRDRGDLVESLHTLKSGLELARQRKDKLREGRFLGNIGRIYSVIGQFEEALHYYEQHLAIAQGLGDQRTIIGTLNNLGNTYLKLEQFDSAAVYYQRCLANGESTLNPFLLAGLLNNMGLINSAKKDTSAALEYFDRSLTIAEKINAPPALLEPLVNLGKIHLNQGRLNQAESMCMKSYEISLEMRALSHQKLACECLYNIYKKTGRSTEALVYLEQMNMLSDSLNAQETAKQLQQMEFDQQVLSDSLANAEKARLMKEAHEQEVREKNRTRNILIGGVLFILLIAGGVYSRLRYTRKAKAAIEKEKDRSENLLLNILPESIAAELKEKGEASARNFDLVSILFTDFKGFTSASEKMSAADLVKEINACFKAFDKIVEKYGIEKIKTIGDAYMAAGGLPVPADDSVKNTVLAAMEMQSFIQERKVSLDAEDKPSFDMRVGIHTGPVVAGIVGIKKFQYDVWGDTVNTASRMESECEVGKVNISQSTKDLLKNDPQFAFESRGKIEVKGKGELEMYFVSKS